MNLIETKIMNKKLCKSTLILKSIARKLYTRLYKFAQVSKYIGKPNEDDQPT